MLRERYVRRISDHQRHVATALAGLDQTETLDTLELALGVGERIVHLTLPSLPAPAPPPPEQSNEPDRRECGEQPVPPRSSELEQRALRLRNALGRIGRQHALHVDRQRAEWDATLAVVELHHDVAEPQGQVARVPCRDAPRRRDVEGSGVGSLTLLSRIERLDGGARIGTGGELDWTRPAARGLAPLGGTDHRPSPCPARWRNPSARQRWPPRAARGDGLRGPLLQREHE